ncbi:MAG TPA: hypothetical protein VK249_24550 [Anaerolineales bacterium]|nr:hypothetical protein [Anaerolineales bacterium]
MDFLNKLFGKKQPVTTAQASSPAVPPALTPLDPSAVDTLLKQPYGAALPIAVNESGYMFTAFAFRESKERIAELERSGEMIALHTRAAFLDLAGVSIYVTLFKIGDQVFEIWWNWHNPYSQILLKRLFDQKEMIVAFFSDQPEIERTVRHPSVIQEGLLKNRSQLTASEPWTMEAFNRARAAVEEQYPTPVALWKALGGGS